MIKMDFQGAAGQGLAILCLGAHSDDIEIGCGGAVLRFLDEYRNVSMYWVVFGANDTRAMEARKSADLFLEKAKQKTVVIKNYRDGFFPYIGAEIKEYFEGLKREFNPDIIFTHYRHDLHQDHRLISELTWNTFRNHFVLEYEIMKYDGDLGNPNYFVHLNEKLCAKKVGYIRECFTTQADRSWFADDAFYALPRLRGIESNSINKYSEAFYCRKIVV